MRSTGSSATARRDDWFLHVHFWDPHTPWDAPAGFGDPFADEPIPDWYTEEIRAAHWELPGAHSAQELTGYDLDPWGWGRRFPRQTLAIPDMAAVKHMFDGYDTGVRYADAAVGTIVARLDDLGVLDETAILVSTDHGEGFGELGVYADHQAADEATCHIPAVLRWPGLEPRVVDGLLYHLDIGATVVDLAGIDVPVEHWDGRSVAAELRAGATAVGRDHLVVSQGAWSCQRSVRWGDHLYASTRHDAFHGWPDEMLFDVVSRPARAARPRSRAPGGRCRGTRAAGVVDVGPARPVVLPRRPDGRRDGRGRPVPLPRRAAGLPRPAAGDRSRSVG